MRILIADDDEQYCLALKKYLEKKRDCQISLAYDGDEARHCIESNIYDVVLIDCEMPRCSGIDLIRVIKKENPQAKIIMVSGYQGIGEDFAKCAGVTEFLRKPFAIQTIDDILTRYEA
ncbi:MAG: hypothetical protein COV72_03530 [Candidatus Omnitrophica bacterium CG11_big_fil_rev_8_21_14_0_20_42_13]|uniref:Response regulatory domain-containing protein n=1 Tax=Candidatus Ghiorseimicrobium undicola TaxID=1974746 RepID=A0A2H0LY65_9BACT|nr:MAG: hypothetical protein COV72_03530 [Candidatus Omnitrophica bacterium CG11_big_fil_rev_8_21_14_0_20_42_13]